MLLTVVTVCVPPAYEIKHLDRLYRMVRKHLSLPFCWRPITTEAEGFFGYWNKVRLFKPGQFQGRVLYLDLDVTVTGSLDDLARSPAPFTAMQDPWKPGINSSVMVWDAGRCDDVYTLFTPAVMSELPGDQEWIQACMGEVSTFPTEWLVSYKDNRRGLLPGVPPTYPPDMRVCVFHGFPRPWEVSDGPVEQG